MTAPELAEQVPGKGRMYRDPETGDLRPSITNIIDILDKPALVGWSARETAKAAFRRRRALMELDEGDEAGAVEMLKNARFETTGRAAKLGDEIHATAEALARDLELPTYDDRAVPYLDRFLQFVKDFEPVSEGVEVTVFNRTHDYAGTFDWLVRVDGYRILIDHKTGKGVYPEVALQLAALRYGEVAWLRETGDVIPMPRIDACIALWLQPRGYTPFLVDASERAFEAFRGLRRAWPWVNGGNQGAVGAVLNRTRLIRSISAQTTATITELTERVDA